MKYFFLLVSLFIYCANISQASALERQELRITIKNHVFIPSELTAPAGKRLKIIVDNKDSTSEEFESYDFLREKLIPGNSDGIILVGPLKKGDYKFFGEFHQKTAQGVLKVR